MVRVHVIADDVGDLVGDEVGGGVAIVVDQLRASTTIVAALEAGAAGVMPCEEVEEARRVADGIEGAVLGGERGGVAIEGFDLGNDPREYTRARVGGRVVVFTTSNGTRAIRRCAAAGHVLVGCLWNLEACAVVAARLAGQVHIVCAGVGGRVAGEDVIAAGALAERVSAVGGMEVDDSARMAVEWWRAARGDMAGAMRACVGGRNLERIGMGEQIEVCARVNVAEMVPRMTDGGMVMGERASGV